MSKAVAVFSGGVDSVCACALLKPEFRLCGISFSYGQRAGREIDAARKLAGVLGLEEHRIVDIGFMRGLYGESNVLTDPKRSMPGEFEYSIVVPVRNAVFLSIASAWAYALNASRVAYGAHTGDVNYPDCRPGFSDRLEDALNHGEIDGIRSGVRERLEIWSPYKEGMSKDDLVRAGYEILGDDIFRTWSCYLDGELHCGVCESCRNRRAAFRAAGIGDQTGYEAPIGGSFS